MMAPLDLGFLVRAELQGTTSLSSQICRMLKINVFIFYLVLLGILENLVHLLLKREDFTVLHLGKFSEL